MRLMMRGETDSSAKREPAALKQVRESALAMLRDGKAEETFDYLLSALEAVLVKTQELELLVAKLRRASWNGKSERMDPAQLSLLYQVLVAQEGVEATADPEVEAKEDARLNQEIESAEQVRDREKTRNTDRSSWTMRGVAKQSHQVAVPESDRVAGIAGER
jgi:hypothetical protein